MIEVMIAVALMSVMSTSLVTLMVDFNNSYRGAQEKNTFKDIRTRVIQEINRPDSWIVTYTNNANFGCLLTATACGSNTNNPFIVYGKTSTQVVLDAVTDATSGFTILGRPCTGYPSANCPIRLTVVWNLIDQGGGNYPVGQFPQGAYADTDIPHTSFPHATFNYGFFGTKPALIHVVGTFTFDPSLMNNIRTDNYGFTLIKEVP